MESDLNNGICLDLLDIAKLAAILHCSVSTIKSNLTRAPHRLPPRVQHLSTPLWMPVVVYKWLLDGSQAVEVPAVPTDSRKPRKTSSKASAMESQSDASATGEKVSNKNRGMTKVERIARRAAMVTRALEEGTYA